MKLTEDKLRILLRNLILEIDEGLCGAAVKKLFTSPKAEADGNDEYDEELIAEPPSEHLEDARDDENQDKKSKSIKQALNDVGVDEASTVAGSLGAPADGSGGSGGRIGPLGDEDRGSIYEKPKSKKKKRA